MQTDYRHSRRRKWKWPKLRFDEAGPKTKLTDLDRYPIVLPAQVCAMLLWTNGGNLSDYGFATNDEEFEEVDALFGAQLADVGDDSAVEDIAANILTYRNALPRWCIPIGRNYDRFFLVTFEHGERADKIFTFDFAHEITDDWFDDDYNPKDPSRLTQVADNLESFMAMLTCFD